tara:strand:+ start:488 stop:1000 length:513 start_codon:yes stop_codon:yes gene_type:complete
MSGTVSNNISQSSGSITEPAGGVEIRSDDPTLSEGLMWYNTTANTLKVARNVAAWSTENNLGTGVYANAGAGTITAGLSFGGYNGSNTAETEEWNGTSWTTTSVGDLASARRDHGGLGVQTAAVAFGGGTNSSEEYNGSSWSSGGTLNESVSAVRGCGTLTAGLRFGGET